MKMPYIHASITESADADDAVNRAIEGYVPVVD
jgi:hypothetical protein